MASFFTDVLVKALVLFVMVFAGYLCGVKNLVTASGAREMTSVLFWVVTPCLMISSLESMIGRITLTKLLISGLLSTACILVSILFSMLFFRRHPEERKKILRFATAYSNCGFMGLPLAQAVLGDVGVAYASMFIAAVNFFVWTHGISTMKQEPGINLKKALLNPGTAGLVAGLFCFVLSIHLPDIILSPMQYFSDLNTPLAMLVVGVYVSEVPLRELFLDRDLYRLSLVRLLLIPSLCFAVLFALHADQEIFTTILILSSAPAAANSVMFAAQFGGDTKLGSKAVALTTLFSVVTMPIFPILVRMVC